MKEKTNKMYEKGNYKECRILCVPFSEGYSFYSFCGSPFFIKADREIVNWYQHINLSKKKKHRMNIEGLY